jgi:tRNA(fMet)-specific endonuclease VapC
VSLEYVLDTNIVSALMRGQPEVAQRLARESVGAVAIPQPVIAEILYGIERLSRGRRKDFLSRRIARIRSTLALVPWTSDVSERFAGAKAHLERAGRRLEDFDVAIAAHALAFNAVLVTANAQHMARIPALRLEAWC